MIRADFIPKSPPDKIHQQRLRAVAISCGLHALALGVAIGATLFYESKAHPNGSPPGGQLTSLPALVIVSSPPEPPAPKQVATPPPSPIPPTRVITSQSAPKPKAKPIEDGVPVLAAKPFPKPEPAPVTTITHPAAPATHVAETKPAKIKPVTTAAVSPAPSSYAPGPNDFPHPPYPDEARDRRYAGTVRTVLMYVQFDASGDVVRADVAHSSGVQILDTNTRTFIRAHWHEPAFAGRTVSIPVAYKLEDL